MATRWCVLGLLLLAACRQRSSVGPSPGTAGGGGTGTDAGGAGGATPGPAESPSEQLLYDLGTNPPGTVYHLHVDGDLLYWAQKAGKLMRGPKAGGAAPELFANWDFVAEGSEIRTDATYVYYYDGQFVKRKPKAGGNVQQYDVGDGNVWGNFIVDGDYIYQAPPWCSPIYRINAQTGEQTVLTIPDVVQDGGGSALTIVGGKLYCATVGGNGGHIYELPADATAAVSIRSGAMMWGLTASAASLVFSTGAATIDWMKFYRLDLATYEVTFLAQAPRAAAGELEFDAARNAIFVNYPSTAGQVGIFHLDSLAFSFLIPSGRVMQRAFTTDADYVYWAQLGPGLPGEIRRISKDAPPVTAP